ncbi:uncharacterized protein LOC125897585 [Epinephelus fuscoguttatus]|uniref:uncharacterized protein LOC125897585 n=1 Tax=Epinephelus fuscoguttatus TaxID=293821 RepID=UPI0020D0E54C|nr:uncharacterized protein LOC125897585 [Epinephelus fuscoguttatus]
MTALLSRSSYEDVGGPKYKYKKESDIQVAGCLVHYILTDGQHPYQTTTPYSNDPFGLSQNVRTGNFTLKCEERWMSQKGIITRMLSRSAEERPTIKECLKAVTCFTHQSDYNGATTNSGNENINKDRTDAANCCPQTATEMDISETAVCDQPEMTDSDLMDSCSSTEEELSVCGMTTEQQVSLSLKMSDEDEQHQAEADSSSSTEGELSGPEMTPGQQFFLQVSDEEQQQSEAEEFTEKDLIMGKPPSKNVTARDPNAHGGDQHNIKVKMSSNTALKRVYDKRNYCLYCERPYAKMARHLKQKHSDKVEVAKALAHRQGSTMRNVLLSKVRNMGNYHHNCLVLSSGKGQIIPKRQATHQSSSMDYLPCKFCYAMYVKTDLRRHHKRCKLQVEEDRSVKRRVQANFSLMLPTNTAISRGLKKILEDMTYDAVTQVVTSDMLIILLGERMFLKQGEIGQHRANIRNKMRELARLVLVARTIDKDIVSLKDLINPGKFNTVLEAVKTMTRFDELINRFSASSTALKLRHSLVMVTYILQGEALRQEDYTLEGRAEQFNKLIELEWTTPVSSNALKTWKKWNNPQMLSQNEDIKKLYNHLKCLEEVNKKALIDHPSCSSWSELSQVTLTQLILFNHHHEGEVSGMEVKTYLQRNKTSMQDLIKKSLTPFEKKLIENLIMIEVQGKRGCKVSVMFPTNVRESMELLIETRDKVGISQSNPYIFARPCYGSQEHIRGCDSIKRYALSCGVRRPENLTPTKLSKHVATISQILNLKNHELDQLATFMGHDIDVHREFYRLPEETLHPLNDIIPNLNSEADFSDSEAEDVQSEQTGTTSQEEDGHSEERAATSRKAVVDIETSLRSSEREHAM